MHEQSAAIHRDMSAPKPAYSILVVEDDEGLSNLVRRKLERDGFTTICVTTGAEAIAWIARNTPANVLMLLDYQLPDMTGKRLIESLANRHTSLPFIITTGHGDERIAVDMMKLGARDYLIKDASFLDLLLSIVIKTITQLETDQRLVESERALKESENKYRMLVELAQEGIWAIDGTSATTFVNPKMAEMLGCDTQEMQGRPIFAFMDDKNAAIAEAHFARCKKGITGHCDIDYARQNGETLSTTMSTTAVFNESGEYAGLLSVVTDITERKRMEALVIQARDEWEESFDIINDAITIQDAEFNILRLNAAAKEMLGVHGPKLSAQKCFALYHGTDHPPERCPSCQAFAQGLPNTTEIFEPHLNKFIEIKALPRFDKEQRVVGLIHVVRDISDRKKVEQQQRNLQAQLLQAQKMEAVGHLAGGIAHDFNNILTAIIGYGNLLLMKNQEGGASKLYIEHILSSAERAANLTRQLLSFSRKQIMNPRPVDLNTIMKGVEKLLVRLIGEDIEIATIQADEDLMVMADPGQIEQILINLATNARAAMPAGGRLTLRTASVAPASVYWAPCGDQTSGSYALFSVSDTGIGMDERIKERIFEPFFTTKEVGKGTGLGLAIVYGIVKQHNGHIEVVSGPGKGSSFFIYLPSIAQSAESAEAAEDVPPEGGTETILLAEDDREVRKLASSVLREFGYSVIEAVDGEDAVSKFAENRDAVDLLILDVIMPKKNGKIACEEIRKMSAGIEVLFISGYTDDIIDSQGIIDNRLDFLPKPLTLHSLLRKVREILDRHPSRKD